VTRRTIEVDGERWTVTPSGRVTSYERDEFGLVFEQGTGAGRVRRFARYVPLGARRWDAALAELSDAQLRRLLDQSQPEWTSPDGRQMRAH
jgi:YD repeat-containing protein